MKNYMLMAGALVLTITACVLVIHFEAAQTQDAMREMARNEIPNGMRDGVEDSIGSVGQRATGADAVGKVPSTAGSVMDGADRVGTSLPKAAETAKKVAGDTLGPPRDVVREPSGSGNTESAQADDRSKQGGVTGQVRSTTGNQRQLTARKSDPDVAEADDPEPAKPGTKKAGVRDSDTNKSGSSSSRSEDQAEGEGETAPKKSDADDREPVDSYQVSLPAGIHGGKLDTKRGAAKVEDHRGQRLFELSTKEERQWGQRLHEQLLDEVKIVHDRALAKRINRITAPLLDARRRRDIEYTFTVIKSENDDINAFSILGGFIYIHSALIDYAKNDEELQFVLAHEIGHVDSGHCGQQLTYTARATELASPIAGKIGSILHELITRPYTKDQEFAADAYAFKAVTAAGQTRQQALAFPRRFGQYLKQHGPEEPAGNKSQQSVAGTASGRIQDHFRSYPSMDERIARLEALGVSSGSEK